MTENPVKAIDHLLTFVRDLDAAARFFDRIGFTLTPESRIDAMGVVNRMILFSDASDGSANFIELMSVVDADRLPPAMARLLLGEEGIKSMVLSLDDVSRAHAHFTALGCLFGPPIHVRREWKLSATESVWPEFEVLLPVDDAVTFNGCQYRNVELYRGPAFTAHPNGARAFDRVYCSTAHPMAVASRVAELLGGTVVGSGVTYGDVTIEIASDNASTRPARFSGYRVTGVNESYIARLVDRDSSGCRQITTFSQTIKFLTTSGCKH